MLEACSVNNEEIDTLGLASLPRREVASTLYERGVKFENIRETISVGTYKQRLTGRCDLLQFLMLRTGAWQQAITGCAMGVFHMIILLDYRRKVESCI